MMTKTERMLVVSTLQFEAIHCWPGAPDFCEFLRFPHRHVFHIRCERAVSHDDRDVEIIQLKRSVSRFLQDQFPFPQRDMGTTSCEQLARMLADYFLLTRCEVLEDGENGAVIERD